MTAAPRLISDDGTEFIIDGEQVIGRSEDCDIRLASDRVSRQHARISLTDEGPVIKDLGSANGTQVNGLRLCEATALLHGDTITIGRFTLRVGLDDTLPGDDATVIDGIADATRYTGARSAEQIPSDTPLPGSWVESDSSEHTEFFGSEEAGGVATVERHSDLPHLLLLDDAGAVGEVFELERSGAQDEQAWELGRAADCDLIVEDTTVSARHAQLIHSGKRWRLVNLVSSNGILVNGEKRLSVYLASADTIQLGRRRLVFFDDVTARPSSAESVGTGARQGQRRSRTVRWILAGGLMLALVALAYYLWH